MSACLDNTVNLGYNDTGYNDSLVKAIRCHGIDYVLREITITSLFRSSLRFQIVLLGNRYNKSIVSRRTQHFHEEQQETRDSDHGIVMRGRGFTIIRGFLE